MTGVRVPPSPAARLQGMSNTARGQHVHNCMIAPKRSIIRVVGEISPFLKILYVRYRGDITSQLHAVVARIETHADSLRDLQGGYK